MSEQPLHKVICLSDKIKLPVPSKRKKTSLLPPINFLDGEHDGIFALPDGGLRRIIKCNGINPLFDSERLLKLEREFTTLLLDATCAIQLVAVTRPFNLDNYRKQLRPPLTKPENEYLKWYADYSDKWLHRVTEVTFTPDTEFFVVITMPGKFSKASAKRLLKTERDQLTKLEDASKNFTKLLTRFKMAPSFLSRSESRKSLAAMLFPPKDSDAFLQEAIPEALSDSTICEPEFSETDFQLTAGDMQTRNFFLSQLPTANWMGWLIDSLTIMAPLTVSVHFQPCSQTDVHKKIRKSIASGNTSKTLESILKGQDKALDISMYVSTYYNSKELGDYQCGQAKEFLRRRGATLKEAKGNQIEAFRSASPLGLDALGVKHRVSTKIAAACWPLFTAMEDKSVGHAIGFALQSREPAFLEARVSSNIFVAGGQTETTESLITLIALKSLCQGSRVLYVGASESISFLSTLLGRDVSEKFQLKAPLAALEAGRLLQMIAPGDIDLADEEAAAEATKSLCEFAAESKAAIFIEEIGAFMKTKTARQSLQKILDFAREQKLHIALGGNASSADDKNAWPFIQQCPTKVIIPQHNEPEFLRQVHITQPQANVCQTNNCGILISSRASNYLRLIFSPMDCYICPDPLWTLGRTKQISVDLRQTMISQCQAKNPKLSETDSVRQGVYYAGLAAPEH